MPAHSQGGLDHVEGKVTYTQSRDPTQIPHRSRACDGGRERAERRQGARRDQHALSEHLAVEGHLPRIRARLRQDGQRHDRRRSQDRGAARGRRGAGVRANRCGVEGHARRRPWRASLSLRQAERVGAVGLGSGLRHGCQHAAGLAQVGGGKELLAKLYASLGLNVVSFPYAPMATQPLGWFKKPVTSVDDFKGIKYRTVGISIDMFTAMGAAVNALPGGEIVSAIDRGLLDAAEFNNASSDRLLGFADVSKVCMLQSYHQNAEQLEITFNKAKYDALPDKMKAIIANAVSAASQEMQWKAIDRYSKDYIELQTKDKVKFYKTPDSILKAQLEIYDEIVKKKSATNPLFKEIVESQIAFARRATQWEQDTVVSRKMAFDYYFGPKGTAKKT